MNIYDLIIVQPIFNALMAIYSFVPGNDFGVAIIIFTIFIRFLLYPLVRRQLHHTRTMQKLQPRLKKIKKNAKGNRQVETMQMMELYKKHGVSPFQSIGILLIQLPIFIGLYHAIMIFALDREKFGRFTYDFLENFAPIKNLVENPDNFNQTMLGFIDLTKHALSSNGVDIVLLVIAVLAGVTQYIITRQTMPKQTSQKTFKQLMSDAAEGKQSDQSEMNAIVMQNMMKVMPIFMFFIMINLPGALALYYTTSNLIAMVQQGYLLRLDEDELEDLADEPDVEVIEKKATKPGSKASKIAKNANVTRITAKDSKGKKPRKGNK